MDSILVRFESRDRQLVEKIEQYLEEQDQRGVRCRRPSTRRIIGLQNHTAHGPMPTELEALQEILEVARARVRRRSAHRFDHAAVHHLSRGIRNHEHRQRVQGMVRRAVPFHHRARQHRPLLSTDQQDHHQYGENVVHEQIARLQGDQGHHQFGENVVHEKIARLQGDQDHRHERVNDIVNEQTARLEGLQLQDTVWHHPVLSPVLSTHMHAGIQ